MEASYNVLKKFEIIKELSYVPVDRLDEVDSFIKFILYQCNIKTDNRTKEPKTLGGIWKNKGFEKITNLDEEISKIRKELGNQILKRHK